MPLKMFEACTEGTENRMFEVNNSTVLVPEVTNYIRSMGRGRLEADKVYYVAKCFRNEGNTGPTRLREFTQIGVELLGDNSLDCRKVVRRDAINLFKKLLPDWYDAEKYGGQMVSRWRIDDEVKRGLNLYDNTGKTFEISSEEFPLQLLGGGPYDGGAGWAIGLERLMFVRSD
jgi:histidyl-tRNA synthetase